MLTAEEVVKSLPMLLKEHPELRTEIYEIISDELAPHYFGVGAKIGKLGFRSN